MARSTVAYDAALHVFALLAAHYPSHLARDPRGPAGAKTALIIHLPTGPIGCHVADAEAPILAGIPWIDENEAPPPPAASENRIFKAAISLRASRAFLASKGVAL